jgi:dienelactone hydrolase
MSYTATLHHIIISLFALMSLCITYSAKAETWNQQLNEQVMMLPVKVGNEFIRLETTVYKPEGEGPFPLLIMNHGKALGNPHSQVRDRAVIISSEFIKRGYAVVIPMRKGFAKSSGNYVETPCNMKNNGQLQANDLQAALNYLVTQNWVDKNRIVVAGQSYGGLATMAFGARAFPGVKGLINFAGGLRIHGSSCPWQSSLVNAFAAFGKQTSIPSLWFYGANDSHFNPEQRETNRIWRIQKRCAYNEWQLGWHQNLVARNCTIFTKHWHADGQHRCLQ